MWVHSVRLLNRDVAGKFVEFLFVYLFPLLSVSVSVGLTSQNPHIIINRLVVTFGGNG